MKNNANKAINSDPKKCRSFVAMLFAAGDLRRYVRCGSQAASPANDAPSQQRNTKQTAASCAARIRIRQRPKLASL